MIAEKIDTQNVKALQIDQLNGFTAELGEMLESYTISMIEAARRGSTYLARAHAVQVRKIAIEVMKATGEAQTLEGALRAAEEGGAA